MSRPRADDPGGGTVSLLALQASVRNTTDYTYSLPYGSVITMTTAGTAYNLALLVLSAGTWLVTGLAGLDAPSSHTITTYLNSASGVGSNSWSVLSAFPGASNTPVQAITAIITTTGVTVYLNAVGSNNGDQAQGALYGTRIA